MPFKHARAEELRVRNERRGEAGTQQHLKKGNRDKDRICLQTSDIWR